MDLPIETGDFPSFFVCLPEGNMSHASHALRDEVLSSGMDQEVGR